MTEFDLSLVQQHLLFNYHYNPVTEPFSTSIIWGRWGRQMAGDVKRPQMAVTEPPWLLLNPPWS